MLTVFTTIKYNLKGGREGWKEGENKGTQERNLRVMMEKLVGCLSAKSKVESSSQAGAWGRPVGPVWKCWKGADMWSLLQSINYTYPSVVCLQPLWWITQNLQRFVKPVSLNPPQSSPQESSFFPLKVEFLFFSHQAAGPIFCKARKEGQAEKCLFQPLFWLFSKERNK